MEAKKEKKEKRKNTVKKKKKKKKKYSEGVCVSIFLLWIFFYLG